MSSRPRPPPPPYLCCNEERRLSFVPASGVDHCPPAPLMMMMSSTEYPRINVVSDHPPPPQHAPTPPPPPQQQHAAVQPPWYMNIPGVRFSPTDEELITYYLRPKLLHGGDHQHYAGGVMHDANVYGEHPVDLVRRLGESTEGSWYVLSPRTRKYLNGKRPRRDTGEDGYWKAMGKNVDVVLDGGETRRVVIGHKRALTYHVFIYQVDGGAHGSDEAVGTTTTKKKKKSCRATEWKMVEYVSVDSDRLVAAATGATATTSSEEDVMLLNDSVLCKITRKEKKRKKSSEMENGVSDDDDDDDDDDDSINGGNKQEFRGGGGEEEVDAVVVDTVHADDPILSTSLDFLFDEDVDSWFFDADADADAAADDDLHGRSSPN